MSFHVQGYQEWHGRYAFKPVTHVVHPFADGVPARPTFANSSTVEASLAVSNDQNARLAG
jgi:hypothetical protein